WIIPLALYLFTFIVAFPPLPGGKHLPASLLTLLRLVTPLLVLMVLFLLLSHIRIAMWAQFALHLAAFLAVALTCHCDLARSRPSAARLTEFFLIVSIGGVLGGIFNTLVAPLIFNGIYEYQVALALGCLMLPTVANAKRGALSYVLDAAAV